MPPDKPNLSPSPVNRLLLLPLLGLSTLLWGQTIYSGQLEIGVHGVDMRGASQLAQSQGHPPLKNQFTGAHMGVYTFLDKWVVGGRACVYMMQEPVVSGKLSLMRYYYGTLHVGRVLLATKGNTFRLYPTAGIGYGTAYLRLDKGVSFTGDVGPGAIADLGLNASWFRSMAGDPRHSLMVSICAGYTTAFAGWGLQVAGNSSSAPFSGPYMRLGMGMASVKR